MSDALTGKLYFLSLDRLDCGNPGELKEKTSQLELANDAIRAKFARKKEEEVTENVCV